MWPDTLRIIREVRPRYAFLENVPGLLTSGYFNTILCDLAEGGYDAEWCVLGADDVGAPHRRKRLWILAYASDLGRTAGQQDRLVREGQGGMGFNERGSSDVAHAKGIRRTRAIESENREVKPGGSYSVPVERSRCAWWDTDPADVEDTGATGAGDRCEPIGADRGWGIGRDEPSLRQGNGPDGTDRVDSTSDSPADVGNAKSTGLKTCSSDGIRNEQMGQVTSSHPGSGAVKSDMGMLAHELASGLDEPRPLAIGYIPRVAKGVSNRVNRLKAIGNGQVPLCAAVAWAVLMQRIEGDVP